MIRFEIHPFHVGSKNIRKHEPLRVARVRSIQNLIIMIIDSGRDLYCKDLRKTNKL